MYLALDMQKQPQLGASAVGRSDCVALAHGTQPIVISPFCYQMPPLSATSYRRLTLNQRSVTMRHQTSRWRLQQDPEPPETANLPITP